MRLIDADSLIFELEAQDYSGAPDDLSEWTPLDLTNAEIADIKRAPTIDAVPVRHGEWIFQRYDDITGNADYECSVCHHGDTHVPIVEVNYCWHCGAKMDGKDDDDKSHPFADDVMMGGNAWEEPEINPCRGCEDYDGKGGCKSNGGCGAMMDGKEEEK